jgi:hypothetical protein
VLHPGPGRECAGLLCNHAEGLSDLFDEVLPQIWSAAFVPGGSRIKLLACVWMEASFQRMNDLEVSVTQACGDAIKYFLGIFSFDSA